MFLVPINLGVDHNSSTVQGKLDLRLLIHVGGIKFQDVGHNVLSVFFSTVLLFYHENQNPRNNEKKTKHEDSTRGRTW